VARVVRARPYVFTIVIVKNLDVAARDDQNGSNAVVGAA
jgi:hypothetical protein